MMLLRLLLRYTLLHQVKRRVAELIHILGLLSKADVRISELSHGEKKRVSIGMS
jgi:ABC-type multidrug transport system ATPase subunit